MDERLGHRLAKLIRCRGGNGDQFPMDGLDAVRSGQRDVAGGRQRLQFGLTGTQPFGPGTEFSDPSGERVRAERAVLEARHPPLDGGLDLAQLGGHGRGVAVQLFGCRARVMSLSRRGVEQCLRFGVEVDQRVEHGTLQRVGADALGRTGTLSAAVAVSAGVVAVAVRAPAGGDAHVVVLAATWEEVFASLTEDEAQAVSELLREATLAEFLA